METATPASSGIGWADGLCRPAEGFTSEMAHAHGWQAGAGCQLEFSWCCWSGASVPFHVGISTWPLGLSHKVMAGFLEGFKKPG